MKRDVWFEVCLFLLLVIIEAEVKADTFYQNLGQVDTTLAVLKEGSGGGTALYGHEGTAFQLLSDSLVVTCPH